MTGTEARQALWAIAQEIDIADFVGALVSVNTAYDKHIKATKNWEMPNGGIGAMDCVFMAATSFISWCDTRVEFDDLEDPWSYLLEDKLGDAMRDAGLFEQFADLYTSDPVNWERAAHLAAVHMGLTLKFDPRFEMPVDVTEECPARPSMYSHLRIYTVRDKAGEGGKSDVVQFTADSHPYDDDYGKVYYGFYGVFGPNVPEQEGQLSHIMDFDTYEIALQTVRAAYGSSLFPDTPEVPHRPTKTC